MQEGKDVLLMGQAVCGALHGSVELVKPLAWQARLGLQQHQQQ
jgi:hypothetical protein